MTQTGVAIGATSQVVGRVRSPGIRMVGKMRTPGIRTTGQRIAGMRIKTGQNTVGTTTRMRNTMVLTGQQDSAMERRSLILALIPMIGAQKESTSIQARIQMIGAKRKNELEKRVQGMKRLKENDSISGTNYKS